MKNFKRTYLLHEQGKAKIAAKAETNAPEKLIRLLEMENSNSYSNGFFRFISSTAFRPILSLWQLNGDECIPFIKCAFGHLIFYHQEQYKVLNPVLNCIDILGQKKELDFVMDILLCDREALVSSFFMDIYEEAFDTLGAPNINEIYAFIPAIRLGGSRSASNVRKVEMHAQMMLLSQL
jgi:hypothetical protein